MNNIWKNATINHIEVALYVPFGAGTATHIDRPFHGLVFNEENASKVYRFKNGFTLHTPDLCVFYLPKGSSYTAECAPDATGGCYAINFDTCDELSDEPFVIKPRDSQKILKAFKSAAALWQCLDDKRQLNALRKLYDIIFYTIEENEKAYFATSARERIAKAESIIKERFTDSTLKIEELAASCGMSGTYFRRLFSGIHGINPKEYISFLREERAKELLHFGGLTTEEIAHLCGFSDVCHFSREFKSRVGITPAKYRTAKL